MATEGLDQILAALQASGRIDASRIEVATEGDVVVLTGSVASAEEATWAETVAGEFATGVSNQLRVDRMLREGIIEPKAAEKITPAADEVLVGSTDMLAGPDAEITSDITESLEENVPWDPPTEPTLAPTQAEYGGDVSFGDGALEAEIGADDPERIDRSQYAAADLTAEDLAAGAKGAPVPSLDPETVAAGSESEEEPLGTDALGASPPEKLEPWPTRLPGASPGVGAVGEIDQAGGSVGGVPATETGAIGADTASADPARSTGGTMSDSGTARGPQSSDDPAIREDFPSSN